LLAGAAAPVTEADFRHGGFAVLVLSRKINQSIAIGDDVRVVVVGIDGDRVTLGIEAPRGLAIRRSTAPRRDAEPHQSADER
jgi:carbon storage regulator